MRKFKLVKIAGWALASAVVLGCAIKAEGKGLSDTNPVEKDEMESTCKMVYFNREAILRDKMNGKAIEEGIYKDKAFQITKGKNWSLVRYNNKTYYVKNDDLDVIEYLFDEMVKYGIRTDIKDDMYISKTCSICEDIDGGELGTLDKYTKVDPIFEKDGWTCVVVGTSTGYVKSENLKTFDREYMERENCDTVIDVDKDAYLKEDATLTFDEEEIKVEKYQKVHELFKTGDVSLVRYNENLYYMPSASLESLGDNYIEVDISEQIVKMYKDSELIVNGDCVTGNTATPTNEGLFSVYEIDGPRYLRGTNSDGSKYKVYVDCFVVFDGNIGFHNVLYRTKPEHFKKDLYLNGKGSHGCVNMYKDDALTIYKNVSYGYKVLVHK